MCVYGCVHVCRVCVNVCVRVCGVWMHTCVCVCTDISVKGFLEALIC